MVGHVDVVQGRGVGVVAQGGDGVSVAEPSSNFTLIVALWSASKVIPSAISRLPRSPMNHPKNKVVAD